MVEEGRMAEDLLVRITANSDPLKRGDWLRVMNGREGMKYEGRERSENKWRMPVALQVPDPEGVVIHANELGLYSKCTIKGFFMQASNITRWPLRL